MKHEACSVRMLAMASSWIPRSHLSSMSNTIQNTSATGSRRYFGVGQRIALFKLDEAEFPDYVEGAAGKRSQHCAFTCTMRATKRADQNSGRRASSLSARVRSIRSRVSLSIALTTSQFPHVDAFLTFSVLIGDENIVFIDLREGLDVVASELAQADFVDFDCDWKSSTASECALCDVHQLASDDEGDLSVLRAVMPKTRKGSSLVVRCLVDMQALTKKIDNHNARLLEATQQLESANNAEDTREDGEVDENEAKEDEQEETVVVAESARKKQKSGWKDRKHQRPTDASQTVSLATLAEQYLGKPLDKRSRLSDWERRPLTRAQLHYAALDAYVLVAIYKKMQEQVSSEIFERFVRQLTKKELGR